MCVLTLYCLFKLFLAPLPSFPTNDQLFRVCQQAGRVLLTTFSNFLLLQIIFPSPKETTQLLLLLTCRQEHPHSHLRAVILKQSLLTGRLSSLPSCPNNQMAKCQQIAAQPACFTPALAQRRLEKAEHCPSSCMLFLACHCFS